MTYRIIKNRNIFLSISGALVVASIIALFTWGLNFGVDFTGGSLLEAEFKNYQPTITELQDSLKGVELNNLTIQSTTDNTFILRFKEAGEATSCK
jgi:preprotein translocase subunit SecF